MLYAVIMAGGSGTRLWPLSRKDEPKQALKLIGERTMFQHAVDRLAPLFRDEAICVVTNAEMAKVLSAQAPGIPRTNFIVEPEGRDSAAAAGLAAVHLLHRDPDATMVILTADHYIADTEQFRSAMSAAAAVAQTGTIVTLGVQPTYPATGYGYIEMGKADTIEAGFKVYAVKQFIEKPDLATALHFLEEHRYLWNSGMFIWRADRLMAEFEAQLPVHAETFASIARSLGTVQAEEVTKSTWRGLPRVSIDYGIMEHARDVNVIPVDFGWSDVGSWSALMGVLPQDATGNVGSGERVSIDTSDCLVYARDKLVATIGLRDVVIVDTPDVLLVCAVSRSEEVREIVKRLGAEGRIQYL